MYILIDILSTLICVFIIIFFIDSILISLPIYHLKRYTSHSDKYILNYENHIDFQSGRECAAFATAYILRFFNINADGNTLYNDFPCKLPDGNITPLGIRKVFKRYGFKTKYYKGNMNRLKMELEKGIPVIVFIHVTPTIKIRHFVPITGFDHEGFYLAESLEQFKNIAGDNGVYNRKVLFSDFIKMWNIKKIYMPFYSFTYICIAPKENY